MVTAPQPMPNRTSMSGATANRSDSAASIARPTRVNAPWNSSPTVKAGGSIAACGDVAQGLVQRRWSAGAVGDGPRTDDIADEGRPQLR